MAPFDNRSTYHARAKQADRPVGDPAMQAMVKQGILRAREKLIDLTQRNGMLNFRHSETSTRHVRIVDQNPEFLANTLEIG
jgi:hypothetical protein